MYVDNCVASVNNIEELNSFIEVSRELMASAQFDLRGWRHNRPDNEESSILNMHGDEYKEIVSVLGLKWDLYHDTLSCEVKEENRYALSKRNVLSMLSRIFDPIGFTSPVTLIPKLILQECWKEKINWDTELPNTLGRRFTKWANELKYLKDLEIPRKLPELNENTTLHVFVDASKSAYAASIFVRNSDGGDIKCQLLQAKSRVAPLKPITIPRLEILACTIGARLAHTVKEDPNLKNIRTFFYTDSMNALYWITKQDNWATFISNRVSEIRKLTNPQDWRHIQGKWNPADLPSRGCNPKELLKSQWWNGPEWLKLPIEEWPASEITPDIEVINSERKKTIVSATNSSMNRFDFFQKVSSFSKIVRIMAYVYRFIKNMKSNPNDRKKGKLETDEIKVSERIVLREIQRESFTGEEKLNLRILKDSDGLLRVQTRIASREDLETFRFPILLTNKHQLVEKLIMCKHIELKHAGTQTLMSYLRESYWIIRSRKTVRGVIRKCIRCRRFSVRPIETVSIPLPEDRVKDAAVFEITGIDLCGPLLVRGEKKCWILLATCAIYRAVHLELVSSLSTDCFILALRRFIARRGRPSTIYSDNGKNLVGTANLLKSIDWEKVEDFASEKRISWKFNPPSAPWWGGFWERLIGVLKSILRRVLGRACLNDEELTTILCDVESIINSRPLTYLSEDPDDLLALTPAMFLQEIKSVGVCDFDIIDSKRLNKRYTYRLKLQKDLRNRFRSEYLGFLKDFSKVKKDSSVKEGDIVLIGDNNTKRINWPLAKVIKTYPGKDGKVRVVELKTKSGTLLRPIQKLYPLEVSSRDFLPSKIPDKENEDSSHPDQQCVPVRCSRYGRVLKPVQKL